MASSSSPRLPRWLRSTGELPIARSRSRISSYLYGNILVLAAVFASTPDTILNWSAEVVVAATTLTTFLAHVVAHGVAQQLGRTDEDAQLHLRRELRDAVPILTSGTLPIVLLSLGALTVLPPSVAELSAALILVVRIALTGILVQSLSHNRLSIGVVWTGIALAGLSLVIVALKQLLIH